MITLFSLFTIQSSPMKTIQKTILFILLLSLICHQNRVLGQDKTDTVVEITPTMSLVYVCNSNDTISLTANLFVRRETGNFALENAEIEFTASSDNENRLLGKVKTDYTGTAIFKVFT